jgi:hypothetical protein
MSAIKVLEYVQETFDLSCVKVNYKEIIMNKINDIFSLNQD